MRAISRAVKAAGRLVLPEPLGPSIPRTWPGPTSRLTPRRTTRLPYPRVKSFIRRGSTLEYRPFLLPQQVEKEGGPDKSGDHPHRDFGGGEDGAGKGVGQD